MVDLLIFSPVFPRSVRYSVVSTDELVQTLLAEGDHPSFAGPEERPLVARLLGRLRGRVDFGSIAEVLAVGLGATAVSLETDLRASDADKTAKARKVGELLAERAKAAGISDVVFDRGGNRYAGRVAAIADGAREGGLNL